MALQMQIFRGILALLATSMCNATIERATAHFSGLSAAEKATYTNWISQNTAAYDQHSFLSVPGSIDPDAGAVAFWKIKPEGNGYAARWIQFAVAVRATGWVGFGLSESGGMRGADVALFQASEPNALVDAYVLESRVPQTDSCQSWDLVEATVEDGWMIVEMSRLLDTEDEQDQKIVDDSKIWTPPTRVIAAWGNTVNVGYHGVNRAKNSVRLFSMEASADNVESLRNDLESAAEGYFDLKSNNYRIPTDETTYEYVCMKSLDILSLIGETSGREIFLIGATPEVSDATAPFVHHFTLRRSNVDCTSDNIVAQPWVYSWAPGDDGMALPDDVGLSILEPSKTKALVLEIHYNNPELIPKQRDSSGVRVYYTRQQRAHRAGILMLADSFVTMDGKNIPSGLTKYQFNCPSFCSSFFLGSQPVTVLAEHLHMHYAGVRATNEVLRRGQVVHTSSVEVFEFDQFGQFQVRQDLYQIKPGDSFRTTCYYRNGSKFGFASSEEMCVASLLYYPEKATLGSRMPWTCAIAPADEDGNSFCNPIMQFQKSAQLNRVFGTNTPADQCPDRKTVAPTVSPTRQPTRTPTVPPTRSPTPEPTMTASPVTPTTSPTGTPTAGAVIAPTRSPTPEPPMTASPVTPTTSPTGTPTAGAVIVTEVPTAPTTASPVTPYPTSTPTVETVIPCLGRMERCEHHDECCSKSCRLWCASVPRDVSKDNLKISRYRGPGRDNSIRGIINP